MNCCRSTKLVLSLTLVIFWCLGGVSNANQVSPASPSTNESPVKLLEKNSNISLISTSDLKADKIESATETELKILKEKNALIADFQNSLISIVIWSLSAVVSVVVLLVGASLFTNFKMHEKDVQRIQLDYDAKIKIFRSEMDTSLAKAGQEMANAQEARSQQDLNRMLDQTAEVRSQFEKVRLSLEEKFDQLLMWKTKLEANIGNLEIKQATLKADLHKAETRIWEIKKIPANVLISALQGLDAALASGGEWQIEDFTSQVKHVIKANFTNLKIPLDDDLLKIIESRLIKLENTKPEDAKEIRQLIAECV